MYVADRWESCAVARFDIASRLVSMACIWSASAALLNAGDVPTVECLLQCMCALMDSITQQLQSQTVYAGVQAYLHKVLVEDGMHSLGRMGTGSGANGFHGVTGSLPSLLTQFSSDTSRNAILSLATHVPSENVAVLSENLLPHLAEVRAMLSATDMPYHFSVHLFIDLIGILLHIWHHSWRSLHHRPNLVP